MRRALVAAVLAVLGLALVGCGDGRAGPQKGRAVVIGFYGDSITSGLALDPRPVERIVELSGGAIAGRDWSTPGMTTTEALQGRPGLRFATFAEQMAGGDPSDVIVIRYGTADAGAQTSEPAFAAALSEMVRLARAAGKLPILVGVAHVPLNPAFPWITSEGIERLARYDGIVKSVATAEGVRFIDVRQVPFAGPSDMLDEVHPAQAYSDRMAALIAQQLGDLL